MNINKTDYLTEISIWSKTFYNPISKLPDDLKEAVGALYLSLRAIDEIEDNLNLTTLEKTVLLQKVSLILQTSNPNSIDAKLALLFNEYNDRLPSVTIRLAEWLKIPNSDIRLRIYDATSSMADRLMFWVNNNWKIETVNDFDSYCFAVSGTPALTLAEIWSWYDGIQTSRTDAVHFGNYLQAVNILRGRKEDLSRGVDFFPDGWELMEMISYAKKYGNTANKYVHSLKGSTSYSFCNEIVETSNYAISVIEEGKNLKNDGLFKP